MKHICILRYADAEDVDASHAWYAAEVAPQEAALPGVRAVRSFAGRVAPQPDDVKRSLNVFHRVTELHVPDGWDGAGKHAALLDGLGGRVVEHHAIPVPVEPEYDLLRDAPPQHYPYAGLPIDWKQGSRPQVDEPIGRDLWRYVYLFGYRDEVPLDAAEDWYIGHHTREGKQLPGLVRYQTWRRRGGRVDGGLYRYTELCFESFETWHTVCYSHGPNWRMSEEYPEVVWAPYHAIFLGPDPDVEIVGGAAA